jgi:hypothetical protein
MTPRTGIELINVVQRGTNVFDEFTNESSAVSFGCQMDSM